MLKDSIVTFDTFTLIAECYPRAFDQRLLKDKYSKYLSHNTFEGIYQKHLNKMFFLKYITDRKILRIFLPKNFATISEPRKSLYREGNIWDFWPKTSFVSLEFYVDGNLFMKYLAHKFWFKIMNTMKKMLDQICICINVMKIHHCNISWDSFCVRIIMGYINYV